MGGDIAAARRGDRRDARAQQDEEIAGALADRRRRGRARSGVQASGGPDGQRRGGDLVAGEDGGDLRMGAIGAHRLVADAAALGGGAGRGRHTCRRTRRRRTAPGRPARAARRSPGPSPRRAAPDRRAPRVGAACSRGALGQIEAAMIGGQHHDIVDAGRGRAAGRSGRAPGRARAAGCTSRRPGCRGCGRHNRWRKGRGRADRSRGPWPSRISLAQAVGDVEHRLIEGGRGAEGAGDRRRRGRGGRCRRVPAAGRRRRGSRDCADRGQRQRLARRGRARGDALR